MSFALWLADWTLKSTLLFLITGCLTLALFRGSAALRHLLWGLALGAALVLPVLTTAAPRWSLPRALPMPVAAEGAGAADAAEGQELGRNVAASHIPVPLSASSALSAGNHALPRATIQDRASRFGREIVSNWPSLLVPVWAIGAALIVLGLMLGILRTRRLRALGRPAPAAAQAVLRRVTARLGLRRATTLLELDDNTMPLTFGTLRPVVLLPAEAAARWTGDRLHAVLLHELAHVKRLDCLTQLIARLACALYWFNPLVWVAARRLRVERELACDDLVLTTGQRPSDYATHLLEIARALRVGPLAGAASIAMARPSQLAGRLLAVLDATRAREVVTGRLAAGGFITALAVIIPLAGARTWEAPAAVPAAARGAPAASAPSAAAIPSAAAAASAVKPGTELRPVVIDEATGSQSAACDWDARDVSHSSASHNANDDQFTVRIKVGACSIRVDGEGEVTFADNDDDIAAISRGGFFHIEERGGDVERRVEIEAGAGGLQRKWLVVGKERPYDAEARAWLAKTLLVVFRRAGFDAENRAQRILKKGGVEAVLQEVAQISSDYSARKYYEVLLTRPNLPQATLQRVVRQAGQEIGSDYELASLLVGVAEHQPLEETVRLAYVEAVGNIGSDYERHRALKPVLLKQGISSEMAAAMLSTAKGISSDYELASLLIEITQSHAIDATLAPAFFDALASVSSDYERHRVLSAVARQGKGDPAVLDRALEAGARIGSDFELASFLIEVSSGYPADRPLPAAFLAAARGVQSDFEHARVLKAVVVRKPFTEANLLAVLESAEGISSDHELAEVVIAAARALPPTERTRAAFLKAAEHISGEYERGRVLSAIFPRSTPTE